MNDFILIAKILSAGKDGCVKVQLFSGFYISQKSIQCLYLDFWGQKKKLELEEVLLIKNSILFKFKGFDNDRDTSLLLNRDVYVLIDDIEKVKSSKFTAEEIIGCKLFKSADFIGVVIDFFETPANPVIEIVKEDGNKILIPFVQSVFERIDPGNKMLVLNSDFGIDDDED